MTTKEFAERLDPAKVEVSPKFRAMLGYMLGEHWTDPEIVTMTIASDDTLMINTTRDPMANEVAGTGEDLWRNLRGVGDTVGLTGTESDELIALAKRKVQDHRS